VERSPQILAAGRADDPREQEWRRRFAFDRSIGFWELPSADDVRRRKATMAAVVSKDASI
jgi:hypothetical protein